MLRSCLAISKGIKTTICKINNFSIVTSICPKYDVCNEVVPKIAVEKFSFSKLKIEKAKYLLRVQKKISVLVFLTLEVA